MKEELKVKSKKTKSLFRILSSLLLCALAANLPAQSGGTFQIGKSVIAGGGGQAAGGTFTLDGTAGQIAAGTTSSGGSFQISGGFWGGGTAAAAANVTVSGRVFTSDGVTGLRNASVTLTDSNGVVLAATTSSFGFYSFDNVAPGFAYTMRVSSRRFRYLPQTVVPTGDLANVDFVGLE